MDNVSPHAQNASQNEHVDAPEGKSPRKTKSQFDDAEYKRWSEKLQRSRTPKKE